MVNSVLLQPLPYAQGNQLIVLRQHGARNGVTDMPFSVSEIDDYRTRNRSLSALVEYHAMTFTLLGGDEPHRVRTGVVSAGFFQFLGVQPLLGRAFVPDDEQPGAHPVLILSYEFWQKQERGDPNIIGRKYQMNDRAAPRDRRAAADPAISQRERRVHDHDLVPVPQPRRLHRQSQLAHDARLRAPEAGRQPGAGTRRPEPGRQATGAASIRPRTPAALGYGIAPFVLREELTGTARPLLWTLLGAAGFVLLIACANVANLILARMARRQRELTIRSAMGAGAGRLLRQLLTESLLLALLAAGVGVAFAYGSMGLLTRFAGQLTPRAREISVDGWVLGFAVLCATATTVLCGTLAAMQARRDVSAWRSKRKACRPRRAPRAAWCAAR